MRVLRHLTAAAVVCLALTACQGADPRPPASPNATRSAPLRTADDNGISTLPGNDVVRRALAAMDGSASVRVKGFVADDGQRVTYDIIARGADGSGTVAGNGETVDLVSVGGFDYAKAGAHFWTTFGPRPLDDAGAALAVGKYVRASHSSRNLAIVTKFLDIPQTLRSELAERPEVTIGGRAIVDGTPTIAVTGPELGTIYVATQGAPYVLRAVGPGGMATGASDFTNYANPVTITAPPASQTIEFTAVRAV